MPDPLLDAMNVSDPYKPRSMGRSNAATPKIQTASGMGLAQDPKMHQFGRERTVPAKARPHFNTQGYPKAEPGSLAKPMPAPAPAPVVRPAPAPMAPAPIHAPELAAEIAAANAEARGGMAPPTPAGPGLANRALMGYARAMPLVNMAHTVASFGGDAVDNLAEAASGRAVPGRVPNDANFLGFAPVGQAIDHVADFIGGHQGRIERPMTSPVPPPPWSPPAPAPALGRNPFQFAPGFKVPPAPAPAPAPLVGPPSGLATNPAGAGRNPFQYAKPGS